jgi:hypothetical protein
LQHFKNKWAPINARMKYPAARVAAAAGAGEGSDGE